MYKIYIRELEVSDDDTMLFDIAQQRDVVGVSDVNKVIRSGRCWHDADAISYTIAMSTMWTM